MKQFTGRLAVIAYVLFLIGIVSNAVHAEETKRVFLVASYEKGHVCGGPQEEGAIKGLNKMGWFEGVNLKLGRHYMDTKRKNTTPEAMRQEAKKVLKKIDAFKADLVIVLDDNAFREVGLPLAGAEGISVVFSGMNGQPEKYNRMKHFMDRRERPGGNVTGVYEKLYLLRSIKVMQHAVPGLADKKFVGITDHSPTGNALSRQFELELAESPTPVKWELRRVGDWDEYTRLIQALNRDETVGAIYPVALSLRVREGVTYTAPEIYDWTMKNGTKPEMALNYFFSKIGLVGGAAVDFAAMGFLAGKKAGAILNGEPTGKIPIDDAPDYAIVFNVKRARDLGIEIEVPLLTAADYVYE